MHGQNRLLPFLLIVMLLTLAGCVGPSQRRHEEDAVGEEPAVTVDNRDDGVLTDQEYVDMYTVGGDDWRDPWQPNIAPPARFDLMTEREEVAVEVEEQTLEQMQGFRIQLADVLTQDDADAVREAALAEFSHVYVTFRSPNYKIRAGDYKSRHNAELELPLARACGFRNAWIVPDWVYVNPPAPVEADSLSVEPDVLDTDE